MKIGVEKNLRSSENFGRAIEKGITRSRARTIDYSSAYFSMACGKRLFDIIDGFI